MKIQRHSLNEEYNVTADWLKDFADSLKKESFSIENLRNIRQVLDSSPKFATIEEKMADIKKRIGFDLIEKMHSEENVKVAEAPHDCGCGGHEPTVCECKIVTASAQHSEDDLTQMSKILSYIQAMIRDRHATLTDVQVISECREHPSLRFDNLPINVEKLKDFISDELKKYQDYEDDSSYMPRGDLSDPTDPNQESEYWSHAFPK